MSLSPRRFWCGLVLLMLCIGCLAIDSVSTRLKRLVVSYSVGSNVTLDDISIRRQAELIKIDGLKVSKSDGASQVNFLSERTYIKVDAPMLLDKRLISPKTKLQGMRLELAAMPLEPSRTSAAGWQNDLQQLLVSLQLDKLKEDCDALMSTDDVLSELDARVRGWVLRSQQIMFHADQLTASIQSFSNPLRHVTEIRQQLTEIEQLRAEQEQLEKQFAQFGTSIDKELAKIQVVCEDELMKLRAKTERGAETVRTAAAEQIVRDWTAEMIMHPLRLGRAITILCDRPLGSPFDVDIRNAAKFPSGLSLSDMEATGLFVCAPASPLRFTASGSIRTEQAADHRIAARTDLNFEFAEHAMVTSCRVVTKESLPAWTVNSSTSCESSNELFQMSTTLSGDQVAGTAKLKIDQYERFAKFAMHQQCGPCQHVFGHSIAIKIDCVRECAGELD